MPAAAATILVISISFVFSLTTINLAPMFDNRANSSIRIGKGPTNASVRIEASGTVRITASGEPKDRHKERTLTANDKTSASTSRSSEEILESLEIHLRPPVLTY
jgi:hypothetical protein